MATGGQLRHGPAIQWPPRSAKAISWKPAPSASGGWIDRKEASPAKQLAQQLKSVCVAAHYQPPVPKPQAQWSAGVGWATPPQKHHHQGVPQAPPAPQKAKRPRKIHWRDFEELQQHFDATVSAMNEQVRRLKDQLKKMEERINKATEELVLQRLPNICIDAVDRVFARRTPTPPPIPHADSTRAIAGSMPGSPEPSLQFEFDEDLLEEPPRAQEGKDVKSKDVTLQDFQDKIYEDLQKFCE